MGGDPLMQPFLDMIGNEGERTGDASHHFVEKRGSSAIIMAQLGCSGDVLERRPVAHRRARSFDRMREAIEFGGNGAQFGRQRLGIGLADPGRGIEQRIEDHRQARQDRCLDPLERLVKLRLAGTGHLSRLAKLG